jgi:hypothetical protein
VSDVPEAFALNPQFGKNARHSKFLPVTYFGCDFLKFNTISCFVFLWDVNRVSPGITGYHWVSPGITRPGFFFGACGARNWRGRGAVPSLAAPPAHDQRSLSSVVFTQFFPFMEMVGKQFSLLWNWL